MILGLYVFLLSSLVSGSFVLEGTAFTYPAIGQTYWNIFKKFSPDYNTGPTGEEFAVRVFDASSLLDLSKLSLDLPSFEITEAHVYSGLQFAGVWVKRALDRGTASMVTGKVPFYPKFQDKEVKAVVVFGSGQYIMSLSDAGKLLSAVLTGGVLGMTAPVQLGFAGKRTYVEVDVSSLSNFKEGFDIHSLYVASTIYARTTGHPVDEVMKALSTGKTQTDYLNYYPEPWVMESFRAEAYESILTSMPLKMRNDLSLRDSGSVEVVNLGAPMWPENAGTEALKAPVSRVYLGVSFEPKPFSWATLVAFGGEARDKSVLMRLEPRLERYVTYVLDSTIDLLEASVVPAKKKDEPESREMTNLKLSLGDRPSARSNQNLATAASVDPNAAVNVDTSKQSSSGGSLASSLRTPTAGSSRARGVSSLASGVSSVAGGVSSVAGGFASAASSFPPVAGGGFASSNPRPGFRSGEAGYEKRFMLYVKTNGELVKLDWDSAMLLLTQVSSGTLPANVSAGKASLYRKSHRLSWSLLRSDLHVQILTRSELAQVAAELDRIEAERKLAEAKEAELKAQQAAVDAKQGKLVAQQTEQEELEASQDRKVDQNDLKTDQNDLDSKAGGMELGSNELELDGKLEASEDYTDSSQGDIETPQGDIDASQVVEGRTHAIRGKGEIPKKKTEAELREEKALATVALSWQTAAYNANMIVELADVIRIDAIRVDEMFVLNKYFPKLAASVVVAKAPRKVEQIEAQDEIRRQAAMAVIADLLSFTHAPSTRTLEGANVGSVSLPYFAMHGPKSSDVDFTYDRSTMLTVCRVLGLQEDAVDFLENYDVAELTGLLVGQATLGAVPSGYGLALGDGVSLDAQALISSGFPATSSSDSLESASKPSRSEIVAKLMLVHTMALKRVIARSLGTQSRALTGALSYLPFSSAKTRKRMDMSQSGLPSERSYSETESPLQVSSFGPQFFPHLLDKSNVFAWARSPQDHHAVMIERPASEGRSGLTYTSDLTIVNLERLAQLLVQKMYLKGVPLITAPSGEVSSRSGESSAKSGEVSSKSGEVSSKSLRASSDSFRASSDSLKGSSKLSVAHELASAEKTILAAANTIAAWTHHAWMNRVTFARVWGAYKTLAHWVKAVVSMPETSPAEAARLFSLLAPMYKHVLAYHAELGIGAVTTSNKDFPHGGKVSRLLSLFLAKIRGEKLTAESASSAEDGKSSGSAKGSLSNTSKVGGFPFPKGGFPFPKFGKGEGTPSSSSAGRNGLKTAQKETSTPVKGDGKGQGTNHEEGDSGRLSRSYETESPMEAFGRDPHRAGSLGSEEPNTLLMSKPRGASQMSLASTSTSLASNGNGLASNGNGLASKGNAMHGSMFGMSNPNQHSFVQQQAYGANPYEDEDEDDSYKGIMLGNDYDDALPAARPSTTKGTKPSEDQGAEEGLFLDDADEGLGQALKGSVQEVQPERKAKTLSIDLGAIAAESSELPAPPQAELVAVAFGALKEDDFDLLISLFDDDKSAAASKCVDLLEFWKYKFIAQQPPNSAKSAKSVVSARSAGAQMSSDNESEQPETVSSTTVEISPVPTGSVPLSLQTPLSTLSVLTPLATLQSPQLSSAGASARRSNSSKGQSNTPFSVPKEISSKFPTTDSEVQALEMRIFDIIMYVRNMRAAMNDEVAMKRVVALIKVVAHSNIDSVDYLAFVNRESNFAVPAAAVDRLIAQGQVSEAEATEVKKFGALDWALVSLSSEYGLNKQDFAQRTLEAQVEIIGSTGVQLMNVLSRVSSTRTPKSWLAMWYVLYDIMLVHSTPATATVHILRPQGQKKVIADPKV